MQNSNPSNESATAPIMIKDPCTGFTYNVAVVFTELDQFFENQTRYLDDLEDIMDFLPSIAHHNELEIERDALLMIHNYLVSFKKTLKGIKRN
ncbi:MAG: hypothetical protein ABI002_08860 [Saprospiraceae bacterium]